MAAGTPHTPVKLRLAFGEPPAAGAFLVTDGGSAYRVERVAGRTIHATRWPMIEVPHDAEIIEWSWEPRGRRA